MHNSSIATYSLLEEANAPVSTHSNYRNHIKHLKKYSMMI